MRLGLPSRGSPLAYKDVAGVMKVANEAGLSRPVARLRPLWTIKA
ncbi:MAG: hypothetical protein EXR54_01060 [Dehalococcoidia bacterium]|nr:hypothetical protein [Dehalococcoidia bacterium]MSQ16147.1 hypothetical protein [Dehalococcoidia bacterium]